MNSLGQSIFHRFTQYPTSVTAKLASGIGVESPNIPVDMSKIPDAIAIGNVEAMYPILIEIREASSPLVGEVV